MGPFSADAVEVGAQSDLIGAPEPMSIEAVLAAPNGGSRAGHRAVWSRSVSRTSIPAWRRIAESVLCGCDLSRGFR
jgi:hypothetical protein